MASKTLDPCDGIKGIREGLEQITRDWFRLTADPPSPDQIEWLYEAHHLDALVTWMKLGASVEFAEDFEATLLNPLREFQRLSFRACQILDGDMEGASTEAKCHRHPVTTAIDRRYALLRDLPDDQGEEARFSDPVLKEIEDPYVVVHQQFQQAVKYLGQVEVSIRAKLGGVSTVGESPAGGNWRRRSTSRPPL